MAVDQQAQGESVSRAVNHGESVAQTHAYIHKRIHGYTHSSQANSVRRLFSTLLTKLENGFCTFFFNRLLKSYLIFLIKVHNPTIPTKLF